MTIKVSSNVLETMHRPHVLYLVAVFLSLLAQYGDDFKRIAASMPNKVGTSGSQDICSILIVLKTTIQVSTFYKANSAALDLETIVRGAPKRSPSPEQLSENWEEPAPPRSGTATPSISSVSTPAEPYTPGMTFASYPFDSRYRSVPMQPPSYGTYSTSYANVTPGTSPGQTQFYSATSETMRAQYGGHVDPRTRGFIPLQTRSDQYLATGLADRFSGEGGTPILGLSTRPSLFGQMSYQAPTSAPATLRTTFQSNFPYSSLSPASFAARNSAGRLSRLARVADESSADSLDVPSRPTSASMAFDTSSPFVPSPQVWTHAPLQTTDDLAAYLDHRTKLAGQQS